MLVCGMDGEGAYSSFWWETNHLKALGINGRIILNGYARNGLSLDWDDLFLGGNLYHAVVKTIVNHWVP